MTKEELIKLNTRLDQSNQVYAELDKANRLEFAKAFVWLKKRNSYSYEDEYRLPTWPEIFIEIGKLLAARHFMDFEGNVSELECKLDDLEKKIRSEIHPNL